MATRTKTKTSVKTKVAIAIASGAVIAAAAAGVYEVDKKSFVKEDVARQEIVQEVQDADYSLRGPGGGLYYASISFRTSVDVPPKANIMVLMPAGLSVDRSSVTIDGSLIGEYFLSQYGRTVVINRDGNGEVIPAGKTIQMLIGKIALVDQKVYVADADATVAIQYTKLAEQLPDLGVSDIYLEGDIVTIMLENQGIDVDTKDLRVSIESDGSINRSYSVSTLADQRFLSASGSSKLQPGAIRDTTTIKVCVDANSQIEESNEDNNCLKRKLDVKEKAAQDKLDLPDSVVGADDSTTTDSGVAADSDSTEGGVDSASDDEKVPETKIDHDNDGDVSTTALLEIVSPNGGEIVSAGDTIEVRWKSDQSRVREVMFAITDGKKQIGFFAKNIPTIEDTLLWTIPADLSASNARIRVVGLDTETKLTVQDYSDKSFAIVRKVAKADSDLEDKKGKDDIGAAADKEGNKDSEEEKKDVEGNENSGVIDGDDTEGVVEPGSEATPDGSDAATPEATDTVGTTETSSRRGGGGGGSIPANNTSTLGYNNLIKLRCPTAATYDVNHPCRTVYYHSQLGTRHAFPNSKVFFTWYSGFGDVKIISKDTMAGISLGQNVTYRPGTRMVKFLTSDVVYTVNRGGNLRAVETERLASDLYGIAWNTKIDDINDAFYTDYSFGAPLITSQDFSASAAIQSTQFISDSL
ncbi:hypothetical protein HOI83_02835 [Candidatus Uhrbacteria bacterium]|nr:hypothetical protein [Candidatus Uhrbacteria bacterium]